MIREEAPKLDWVPEGAFVRPEDALAANEKLKRLFMEQFEALPERVTDDVATQEAIRAQFDKVIMNAFGAFMKAFGHEMPPEE